MQKAAKVAPPGPANPEYGAVNVRSVRRMLEYQLLPPSVQRAALLKSVGLTDSQVARLCGVSHQTVKGYLSLARDAVGAKTTIEALLKLGVIEVNPKLREDLRKELPHGGMVNVWEM